MNHVIAGTRAQLIKMAPIMREMRKQDIPYRFILLAQHTRTMADMMEGFGIPPPDIIVGARKDDIVSTLQMVLWAPKVLAEGWWKRNKLFDRSEPGVALVHGDAPPMLLGALLAKASGLRVVHVEAGLRSFNLRQPFPEELIRVLAAKLGLLDTYICQDEQAVENLKKMGKTGTLIRHNTILDAIRLAQNGTKDSEPPSRPFALASIHRFETLKDRNQLQTVCEIIQKAAEKLQVRFILHPPTEKVLQQTGWDKKLAATEGILMEPRKSFFDFARLMRDADYIMTDGGSNQEECYYLGKPCLILRQTTERVEGLGENAVLSEFDPGAIAHFLEHYTDFRREPLIDQFSPSREICEWLSRHA